MFVSGYPLNSFWMFVDHLVTRGIFPLVLSSVVLLNINAFAIAKTKATQVITLERAYQLAIENAPSLKLLQQRVKEAEAARLKAWAALKPTASFQGTFTHNQEEIAFDSSMMNLPLQSTVNELEQKISTYHSGFNLADTKFILNQFPSDPMVIQRQNQFGFNIGANLPIFRGPAYPAIGITKKQIELVRLSQIRSRKDFLLQVAQVYYQVVSQQEIVRTLENQVQVDSKHLEAAKARFSVGQDPRSVVIRAELVVIQHEQNLHRQQIMLRAAKQQLAIMLGVSGLVEVTRPTQVASIDDQSTQHIEQVLQIRQDYQASKLSYNLAQRGKHAIWWRFAPTLDLNWGYQWSQAEGFSGKRGMWRLMLNLNVPIYDGGLRYADLRTAQVKLREADLQRQALAQQIEQEIVTLRAELSAANTAVDAAKKSLKLVKTLAGDMEASFTAGAVTQLEVLDANQRLLNAEIQLTSSLFNQDLTRLKLSHALGTFAPMSAREN